MIFKGFSPSGLAGALALLIVLGLAGCGDKKKDEDLGPDVLATVNGEPVREVDLTRALAMLPIEQRRDLINQKGFEETLENLITWRLMAQEAENRRLDETAEYKERMDLVRQQTLVNLLLDSTINDQAVYKYFQENFRRGRFIYIRFPVNPPQEAKAEAARKAGEVHQKILAGGDFGPLADEYSDDPSGAYGGEMGYLTQQALENMGGFKVAETFFSMEEGDLSEPVEGTNGYYIFQLVEKQGNLNPRGLTPELSKALKEMQRDDAIRSFQNELSTRPDAKIVRYEENIQGLIEKYSPKPESQDTAESGDTMESGDTAGDGSTLSPEIEAGDSAQQ